jgi:23S rRNA (adenine-N6)-dimethyltransferase
VPAESGTRWGWHQLDSRWARRVVEEAGIAPGDLVLDVGAGTGALTAALVAVGARVIAIELHPQRAAHLAERFDRRDVTVVRADASDLRLPRRPFKVVANPPFGITASLVKRLLSNGSRLLRADLIVPTYAARRWTSPTAPGLARWGVHYSIHLGRPPPRSAFRPPPPSGVALLVIERRGPTRSR